jgi:hypothetical protein
MKRYRPELGLCATTKNWLNVAATLCPGEKSPLHTASENIWTPQPSGQFGKEISLIYTGLGKEIFCGLVTVPSELLKLHLSKHRMFCNDIECGKECWVCGLNPFQKHSTPLIIAETTSNSIFTPRVRTRWRHDMR